MKRTATIAFIAVTIACASCIFCTLCVSCSHNNTASIKQIALPKVEQMPNLPQPYKIINYKQKALDYDKLVFSFTPLCEAGTFIWLDSAKRNIPQVTFGLYTAIHDVRMGAHRNNGECHESINSLAALIGAGLMGIDKTNQNGFNFVKMVQNYFNSETGWNIMMNNTNPVSGKLGGGYGRDWWYDVLPNVLYYALCDIFPNVENADNIQYQVAEQFYKADSILNGNYDYSYFDYAKMQGMRNQIPYQQDAAGGHGYVLYAAYQKFKDLRYLEGAKSAIKALDEQKESRFYEILLPMGCYTAARLNAEQGTNYDIEKMLNWVFDGCKNPQARHGWGVISGTWGNYDISGLQGSLLDSGGYAFFMNSMKMAIPLVPLVKYQPQFARAIGKWMLNNVNAARLFYPDQIDDEHQALPEMKNIANGVIAYEGLRYQDAYNTPRLKNIHPVALGDGPNWMPDNPKETMFSLYSTSPAGVFGAMTDTTNVTGILRFNCNTTDFYSEREYPIYLYYNPYKNDTAVTYHASSEKVHLYDIVSKKYFPSITEITLTGDNAAVIVELPLGIKLR
ncbi:MAG: hypothetical protein LBG17_03720 [Bacteroidales bacterium]|jgi:hypothetical protein|nr:hypothetical protein [Bacteroidales bacterium]